MSDDRCIHDFLPGQCALCEVPPPGARPKGHRTRGGSAYHKDRDCPWLAAGQNRAHRSGLPRNMPGTAVPVCR